MAKETTVKTAVKRSRTAAKSKGAEHAYYNEAELYRKASATAPSVTSFPITAEGVLVAAAEANSVQPGGTVTWYLNGPPGTSFSTRLSFDGGGGHSHGAGSSDPVAAGTISPASGTLQGPYPQNLRQTFRAGETCGQVRDTTVIGNQTFVNPIVVAIGGLQALTASTGVVLVGSTSSHPSNHWGTPGLCNAIRQLGAAFHQQFNGPIYVNDMSLVTGGLLDINGNFRTPHITHRDGRHVDMNWSSMSEAQRQWFKARAEQLGFHVELHENPTHWHLRFG